MRLLSESQLASFERHLAGRLNRLLDAQGLGEMKRIIRDYVLAGGKRVRPQLCLWSFEQCGGDVAHGDVAHGASIDTLSAARGKPVVSTVSAEARLDVACAWELFHAFLLAHDDIIDSADTRRTQAALHRQLASLDHNSQKFGESLGIVAGDLLFSAAMALLHEIDLPLPQYRSLLRLFTRVSTFTGFGQAIDICQSHAPMDDVQEATLLREYHWKTAAYTFEGPMLAGAILAGADDATQAALSAFAIALGQAYQLHNDLLDLSTPAHEGCDIVQGKRTPALIAARTRMDVSARQAFDRRLDELQHANGRSVELADGVRRELLAGGAAENTRARIDKLLADSRRAIDTPSLTPRLRNGLGGLLNQLQSQYFAV